MHKKSWNFSYAYLGVPRPAKQVSKAHDSSQAFTALLLLGLFVELQVGKLERKRFIIC